ncbi:NADPH:quinone reductase-like Zn-dependent oxidoreductase [Sphingobium wenxiniae]|uniref:NADPH:quinone reductase-like Zn-dependent oxidoreductase n=2 Tax=Sphingomonadaceae TaxID=41297 RepID=A0A562K4T6_SPHWJ|nr:MULTISPECIES: NADP-dependent oxidoreductase [Sphingomonadaceae]MBB6193740.1 NADPH:quinone reductase-like Zn-dependent oxidoreductase [Sphingobium wenxiniae]MDE8654341.1 NADP-dependent oxidoreductase [Novosphingobium album (ex Liu et al. 2023)]MDF0544683.1 NADP-dependent oxidoreductase [Sphingobium arseniciresistens]TWH90225.1 NADPH:quinone reductase-like Zn-dependent oxidoreductase [Sphingobium wenxiniae]
MKAFILDRYGKQQALRPGDMPEPTPGPDDVVVEVEAAGLNLLDSKIRDGAFKPILPYKTPLVLGHDLAGTVVRVGADVRRFKPGDAVYARPRDGQIGTFAERIAVKEGDLALKPASLSMVEATSIPLVGLTAWQVLIERAQIKPGQKVLIHAGSGGVGTFAIQLAKHLGATVATTASAANAPMLKDLGADIVIDYRSQKFEEELSGYDVVLNSLDAATLEKSLKVLKPGGKLISISGPPDPAFARAQGLNAVLRLVLRLMSAGIRRKAKRAGVDYSFLFMRADGEQLGGITKLIENGIIRPVVDRTFPFEKLNDAFAYIDTGRAKGKVVVTLK